MRLDLHNALRARLEAWRADAYIMERYGGGASASTLIRCALDLQELLDVHEPRWVNVKDVTLTTGRSRSYLQSRCREDLAPRGLARKTSRGWEIALEEAQRIPPKRERVEIEPGEDVDALARRFGREE